MNTKFHLIIFSILAYGAFVQPAHAYLDPGTGSILLQSIIGGIAAIMLFGREYLFRSKQFLYSWFSSFGKKKSFFSAKEGNQQQNREQEEVNRE